MRSKGRISLIVSVVVLVIPPETAKPQQEVPPVPHFLERGYLFNTVPSRNLVFEAQLAEHIFFYDNLASKNSQVMSGMIGDRVPVSWAFSVSFTPLVRLRMLTEASLPVRTPSYMPRFDLMFYRTWRTRKTDDDLDLLTSPVRLLAFHLTPWGHHSNGQDGCLFGSGGEPGADCPPFPDDPKSSDVNRRNGSFSTNYFRVGFFFKQSYLKESRTDWFWAVGTRFEGHPTGFGPGAISPGLQRIYGKARLWGGFQIARAETWAVEVQLEGIFGAHEVPPVRTTQELSWYPGWFGEWGFFTRHFYGQDYYNLGFLDARWTLEIGLVKGIREVEMFPLPFDRGQPEPN